MIALALAACTHTPPAESPVENRAGSAVVPPHGLELVIEHTECFGTCPAYTVKVHADGRVEWTGTSNVKVLGPARDQLDLRVVDQIDVALEASRFFERERDGQLPKKCTPPDTVCETITICSDTSHWIITATRGGKRNEIDDGCQNQPDVVQLEKLLSQLVGVDRWIGK